MKFFKSLAFSLVAFIMLFRTLQTFATTGLKRTTETKKNMENFAFAGHVDAGYATNAVAVIYASRETRQEVIAALGSAEFEHISLGRMLLVVDGIGLPKIDRIVFEGSEHTDKISAKSDAALTLNDLAFVDNEYKYITLRPAINYATPVNDGKVNNRLCCTKQYWCLLNLARHSC